MSLVRAPQLGIERFANDRDKESWSIAASEDKDTIFALSTNKCLASST